MLTRRTALKTIAAASLVRAQEHQSEHCLRPVPSHARIPSRLTKLLSGTAMPSSASGRTGDRNPRPSTGDWYARNMYIEGQPQYKYHVEHVRPSIEVRLQGRHPDVEGRAVRPQAPRALISRPARSTSSAWESITITSIFGTPQYRRWNSVRMGPQSDIVGEWREAARAEGLRFGVSEHVSGSYTGGRPARAATKRAPSRRAVRRNDPQYAICTFRPRAGPENAWAGRATSR